MNCLFVGAGAIADEYAAGLSASDLTLAGVVDLDGDRAAALAAAVGEDGAAVPSFTDVDAALAALDAPLVVNLTSHAAHASVTRTALAADRHVYSQKPLALDADEAGDLLALARRRGLALGCAPDTPRAPSQRRAGRLLADGRLGPVQLGYAHAHVGRVTDWHDRPDSFLEIGPLYDGAVYPLTLLVSWFGPVDRVRVADALDAWPAREMRRPSVPSHVEATLSFAAGPTVRLTASFYAPHRAREFYGLELHGDDGSLYLRGTGAMTTDRDDVRFGRVGREYASAPPQSPPEPYAYVDAVERLAASAAAGSPSRETGRRGAHVVAVCNAIETAADDGGPVPVDDYGATADPPAAPVVSPPREDGSAGTVGGASALRLPPIASSSALGWPDSSIARSASSVRSATVSGVAVRSAPIAAASSRRRSTGSTTTSDDSGNDASSRVTHSPMTPAPKTTARSPSSGAASRTRFVAVSTEGRSAPTAGAVPSGSATTSSGAATNRVWCGTNPNTDRPSQSESTRSPTASTTPLAA
ncbi:Gfo/Idh/MocA family protein [Halorubrum pallidum]